MMYLLFCMLLLEINYYYYYIYNNNNDTIRKKYKKKSQLKYKKVHCNIFIVHLNIVRENLSLVTY